MTLTEIMAVATIGAIGAGVAAPSMTHMLRSWKLTCAARDIAVQMQRARMEAVAQGAYVGILYEKRPEGGRWRLYRDGGARGIHASEIASGADTPLGDACDLEERYSGVRFGIAPPGGVPRIPPATGMLSASDDPIAFGGTDIFSAAPTGETSSGAVYLTDGSAMRGVVVFGATGRIRVWSHEGGSGGWRQ